MTQNLSTLPYDRFFVVGAMKSGTSTLCHLLGQHSKICLSDPKEPEFFTEHFSKGWGWYDSLFKVTRETELLGDGSTGYAKAQIHPDVSATIASYYPSARIIYIVRDPFDRIRSQWSHKVRMNTEHKSLEKAVRSSATYLDTSRYWYQISKYRDHFPDKQILVLFTSDLYADQENMLDTCFKFLGIPPHAGEIEQEENHNVAPPSMTMESTLVHRFKNLPGKSLVTSLVPVNLKRAIKNALRKPIEVKPDWPDGLLPWLHEELREDAEAFLKYAGKPADHWLRD